MAFRLAHIYLPRDRYQILDDLTEKFDIIEHYEVEAENKRKINFFSMRK